MQSSDSDAQLLDLWRRVAKDFVQVAFDPLDGDTVTVSLYSGQFWPNLVAWRAKEKRNAQQFNAKLVALDRTTVGTHRAYTSIGKLRDVPLLIATAAVEQTDGRYVIVSAALDRSDRRLAEQILTSVKIS